VGRNKRVPPMMGITSPSGSHLPTLERAIRDAPAAYPTVLEHGAGLYSTPLLIRLGCNVLSWEPHPGWQEWARWMYEGRCRFLASFEETLASVEQAHVVFVDGPALERGPLLSAAISAGVPSIVVHNTEEGDWPAYALTAEQFSAPGYKITHHAVDSYRTTLWRR
jgi:hypothetical protein